MKHDERELDRILDETLDEIRESEPEPLIAEQAASRVWQQLEQAQREAALESEPREIHSCSGFQALIPDYVKGELAAPKALLLKDHLGECVTCRRALREIRPGRRLSSIASAPSRPVGRSWVSTVGWRAAAAAVIFVALVGFSFKTDVFSFESGGVIRIESVDGELLRVTQQGTVPVVAGDVFTLEKGEGIRTAKGSTAMLRLADNSRVEMAERSELAVLDRHHLLPGRRSDGVVDLERGSIIIEASDQGSGHLYVDTKDCSVAVQGTVFAVNHGVKGSRVSVIEGEVAVNHSGNIHMLRSGDQATTNPSLAHVRVEDEIAWSRNAEQHRELLREMQALGREIDQIIQPGLRYATDLLDVVPAATVVYVAVPNVSGGLGEAYELIKERVNDSEKLGAWWDENFVQTGVVDDLDAVIERIRAYGDHLGEEIVLTVQRNAAGEMSAPLILARLERPAGFVSMLEDELDEHNDVDIRLYVGDDRPEPTDLGSHGTEELHIWVSDDLVVVTPEFERLDTAAATISGGATLEGSAFHAKLASLYEGGVEWAVGVDLGKMIGTETDNTLEVLGLSDVEHLIAERRQLDGMTQNRIVLSFDQPRRSLVSWLAEPAPMGSLDFVSPNANLVIAAAMKDMDLLVDELFSFLGSSVPDFEQRLEEFEAEHGIDIRRDFAAPLGGEFALALDGPVLPVPSWKLILEVYDPARLQQTLDWLVQELNKTAGLTGGMTGFQLTVELVGGREFFRLQSVATGLSAYYVFVDGYMIAGPSRGLLDRTLQNRAAGIRLPDSTIFTRLLPRDGQVHFSGIAYQNLASILGPLSKTIGSTIGHLAPEQQDLALVTGAETAPSLAVLYGEEDRIVLVTNSEGGLFSSSLGGMLSMSGLMDMHHSIFKALASEARDHQDGGNAG